MAVPSLNSAVNWRHTLITSLQFTELVPGVQTIEHGKKIEGRLGKEEGARVLTESVIIDQ